MKAIRIHRFGGPEVLQLDEIDVPTAGGDKLLIRVIAASVNPVDYKIRRGGYPRVKEEDLPVTLGRDVAGVVETAAGEFKVGDEVFAHLAWSEGGYAEHAVVAPAGAALKPKSLDMITAAGVPLVATTAWQGLFEHGGLKAGQRVLIHGGSGGVGGYAVQFAHIAGAHVFTTASGDGVKLAKDYGADEVIDYRHQKFEDVAVDLDLVLDLVGGETQERSFAVLKRGGALISAVQPPNKEIAAEKNIRIERYIANPNGQELRHFAELIDTGKLKTSLSKTFPLARAADAHRFLESEHPRGKIVLTVA
jgi:NADPH:quinone reductase-like Zn-dependent oxidoreductase